MQERGRVRIKCSACGTINLIPAAEFASRTNDEGRPLCCRCCKAHRWESEVCKRCSDRAICSGEFREKMGKFLEGIGGV